MDTFDFDARLEGRQVYVRENDIVKLKKDLAFRWVFATSE